MSHNPKISVIIPSYNSAATIFSTIKSVLSQTYKPSEIIVVDDGSNDDTRSIIDAIDKENIELNYFKINNAGPSTARNFGVSKSRYDFIAFLDADDIWDPKKLKLQVELMNKTNKKAVSCEYIIFESKNYRKLKMVKFKWNENSIKKWILLEGYGALLPSTLLVEKKLFLDLGGYREDLYFAEDADLAFRILSKHEVAIVNIPLVSYRLSEGQLHKNMFKFALEYKNLTNKLNYLSEYEKFRLINNVEIYLLLQNIRNLNLINITKFFILFLRNPIEFSNMLFQILKRNADAKINLKKYESN